MKPCPNCNSPFVGTQHDNEPYAMKHATCSSCYMEGPHTKTVEEAIAAWDNLPRKMDKPTNHDITLTADGTEYLVSFMHVGPVTFCGIVWREDGRMMGTSGAAACHPKDAFDVALGEKVAMRKACGIRMSGYVWAKLPEVYSAYRKMFWEKEMRAELDPFGQIPATPEA